MLKDFLFEIYESNPYVKFLKMEVSELGDGYAEIIMPVEEDKHTNLYNVAHGGALASLADTSMGVACAASGNKVVTLEMNMNFIKAAAPQKALKGIGRVVHGGKSTMVAEVDIIDGIGQLILKARGTFFVVGKFDANEKLA